MSPNRRDIAVITLIAILAISTTIINSTANLNHDPDQDKSYNPPELTDKNFASTLNNSTLLVLTIYYPGCGYCKFLNKTTLELSNELHGQIQLYRINAQNNDSSLTLKKYKVSTVPALLIFDNGILVNRMKGNTHKFDLLGEIKELRPDLNTSNVQLPMTNGTAEDWLQNGNELLQIGLYDLAIKCYDQAIAVNPNYSYAWSNKCSAFGFEGKFNEAAQSCDEAIRLDPELIPAWMGRGSALFNLNKTYEAVKAFDKVISLDPNNAVAWSAKGSALKSLGNTTEADAAFAEARARGQ